MSVDQTSPVLFMGNEKHWQHARLLEAFVLVEIDFQLMCDSLLLRSNRLAWF